MKKLIKKLKILLGIENAICAKCKHHEINNQLGIRF